MLTVVLSDVEFPVAGMFHFQGLNIHFHRRRDVLKQGKTNDNASSKGFVAYQEVIHA